MKNHWLAPAGVLAGIFIAVLVLARNSYMNDFTLPAPTVAPSPSPKMYGGYSVSLHPACAPKKVDIERPKRLHFSAGSLDKLRRSYSVDSIRGFQSAIAAYMSGTADADTIESLDATPRSQLSRPFTLMSVNDGVTGGTFIIFQFRNDRRTMYEAWVYRLSGGAYTIRGWGTTACTPQQQRWQRVTYAELFAQGF